MKSKFFGVVLGLALSIQGVEGMQNPDMEAWLEAEFDKCSQGADVRVRQVFDKGLAIDVGNKQYIIDAKGNIYHRVWGTDSLDDSLWKVAVRMKKDAYEEWTGRTDPNCSDIKCNCSAAGALLSVNIQDKINFLYNFISGELILNNTAYDKKLVVEANRICTAKTVNVKDLILKSYEDWFLNFGQLNHQQLRLFSHFGVNYGSFDSKEATNWNNAELLCLFEKSQQLHDKYAGKMTGFYSSFDSKLNAKNVVTKYLDQIVFSGETNIGTLDSDGDVTIGLRLGVVDCRNLLYPYHIDEIKNAKRVFVSTKPKVKRIDDVTASAYWMNDSYIKKYNPEITNFYYTEAILPFLVGDKNFNEFSRDWSISYFMEEAVKQGINDKSEDVRSKEFFKNVLDRYSGQSYDLKLFLNDQNSSSTLNIRLKVDIAEDGLNLTFYNENGKRYPKDIEGELSDIVLRVGIREYWRDHISWINSRDKIVEDIFERIAWARIERAGKSLRHGECGIPNVYADKSYKIRQYNKSVEDAISKFINDEGYPELEYYPVE